MMMFLCVESVIHAPPFPPRIAPEMVRFEPQARTIVTTMLAPIPVLFCCCLMNCADRCTTNAPNSTRSQETQESSTPMLTISYTGLHDRCHLATRSALATDSGKVSNPRPPSHGPFEGNASTLKPNWSLMARGDLALPGIFTKEPWAEA